MMGRKNQIKQTKPSLKFLNLQYGISTIILQAGQNEVAPVTHVHNKDSNIQGRSPNVVKVIFHAIRDCSQRKEFSGNDKFLPF